MKISESSQRCPVVLRIGQVAGLQPAERDEEAPGEEDSLDGLHHLHGLQLPVVDVGDNVARPETRLEDWTVRGDGGDEHLQGEILQNSTQNKAGMWSELKLVLVTCRTQQTPTSPSSSPA